MTEEIPESLFQKYHVALVKALYGSSKTSRRSQKGNSNGITEVQSGTLQNANKA
ncbi:MAG: hypothetical protein KIH08_11905 [Candidatus Freyarchaeota archaeon]|nr:hypothetical protein [Candidatus Jordarchaeia archaeon]MBS7267503.1 hypothetical protein [Candidatus Jordarchaeia archaeon]